MPTETPAAQPTGRKATPLVSGGRGSRRRLRAASLRFRAPDEIIEACDEYGWPLGLAAWRQAVAR